MKFVGADGQAGDAEVMEGDGYLTGCGGGIAMKRRPACHHGGKFAYGLDRSSLMIGQHEAHQPGLWLDVAGFRTDHAFPGNGQPIYLETCLGQSGQRFGDARMFNGAGHSWMQSGREQPSDKCRSRQSPYRCGEGARAGGRAPGRARASPTRSRSAL